MSRLLELGAVFAVVFAVTTAGLLAGSAILADDPEPERIDLGDDRYALDALNPDTAPTGGDIEIANADGDGTVVVHSPALGGEAAEPIIELDAQTAQVDGPTAIDRDISPLVNALVLAGHSVELYGGQATTLDAALVDATGFLSTAPETLSGTDREAIDRFTDEGGNAVIATSPGQAGTVSTFTGTAGIVQEPGFVYNVEDNDRNHLHVLAEPADSAAILDGVDEAVLRSPAPITADAAAQRLTAGEGSEHSIDQESGTFGVAAESENMLVLGDAGFMSPEFADRADNDVLIGNIGDYLLSSDRDASIPEVDDETVIEPIETYYRGIEDTDPTLIEDALHADSDLLVPAAEDLDAMAENNYTVTDLAVGELLADRAYVTGTERFDDPDTGDTTTFDVRIDVRSTGAPDTAPWKIFNFLPPE